jgi:hypothetical protein
VWIKGPRGAWQLMWLTTQPGRAGGWKVHLELSSLAPALGLAASFSATRTQSAVRFVGSAGWNDGVDEQFPAAPREWEFSSPELQPLLSIREATRAEAKATLDANALLGQGKRSKSASRSAPTAAPAPAKPRSKSNIRGRF